MSAASFLPRVLTLDTLREAARGCTGCPLYQTATQTVFGEGLAGARVMLVGEQPGDKEDLEGRPFVGPAGRLLDRALEEAGIARTDAYVTNVVKHFKWAYAAAKLRSAHVPEEPEKAPGAGTEGASEATPGEVAATARMPRGKRRLHQKPGMAEIGACRPWLDAELQVVKPQVIVALGATAAQALLGKAFRVTKQRGELLDAPFGKVLATVHPSSVLRAPDDAARREAYAGFVSDLRIVAASLT